MTIIFLITYNLLFAYLDASFNLLGKSIGIRYFREQFDLILILDNNGRQNMYNATLTDKNNQRQWTLLFQ